MDDLKDIRLSVIIPVYQSTRTVLGLLDSLEHQKTIVPFEVLIIDDASSNDTPQRILDHLARKQNLTAQLLRLDKNEGPAVARNAAISKASGDCFLLVDSDCLLPSDDHLARMWQAHCEDPAAIVGGAVRGRGKGYTAFCDRYCHWSTNVPGRSARLKPHEHLVTAHMMIPRAVWEKIGPFDRLRTGEDTVFCLKAHRAGISLRLRGDICAEHDDRETWSDFIRCFYECGRDREATRRLAYGKSPWFLSGPRFLRFFMMPVIALGLTLSHLKAWWRYDKRVLLALPGIFVGMLAMAYGVFVGKRASG